MRKSAWREHLESLVWAAALALAIRAFIVAPFKIPSGSMRPTLIEGDRILVNKFLYRFRSPQRGDIIVFRFPTDPKRPFIKRLIAVGGDRVEIHDGHPLVNGQPLTDPAVVRETTYYNQGTYGENGQSLEVPAGHYYVLGDNSSTPFSGMAQTALHDALSVAQNIGRQHHGQQPLPYSPKKPISVIPVGSGWAAVEWDSLQFTGWIGSLMRLAADLIAFHDLESWPKAGEQWMQTMGEEESCPICIKSKV